MVCVSFEMIGNQVIMEILDSPYYSEVLFFSYRPRIRVGKGFTLLCLSVCLSVCLCI